jgi:hypothetical protein
MNGAALRLTKSHRICLAIDRGVKTMINRKCNQICDSNFSGWIPPQRTLVKEFTLLIPFFMKLLIPYSFMLARVGMITKMICDW